MAVRDDFAAGEVLAAADLNDTFASKADYPSGGSNGDLLTKSGTTTAWATPPSLAGFVLTKTETFSAVSAVNINSCFSSTYDVYRLTFTGTASSAGDLIARWRVSGTDASGNDYADQYGEIDGSGYGFPNRATGKSNTRFGYVNTARTGFAVDIFNVALATPTVYLVSVPRQTNTIMVSTFAGVHSLSTAYDGITLSIGSGTITGTVRVYGLRNS